LRAAVAFFLIVTERASGCQKNPREREPSVGLRESRKGSRTRGSHISGTVFLAGTATKAINLCPPPIPAPNSGFARQNRLGEK
jgi:hypothetical protein